MDILWLNIVRDLLINGLVVIAIGAMSEAVLERFHSIKSITRKFVSGLTFSVMAMTSMMMTIVLMEGIIFDSRYIIIMLSLLFGGLLPGIMTTLSVVIYRLILGGSGTLPAIGASAIVFLAGLLLRRIKVNSNRKRLVLFAFAGLFLAVLILLAVFSFSPDERDYILNNYISALFLIYPLMTVGLALILDEVSRRKYSSTENRYKSLIHDLPQKIFLKDLELKYLFCNDSYASDLNITPFQIVGKDDYNFYPEELAEKYREDDRRILETGKEEMLEEKYKRNDEFFWVQTVKKPIYNLHGNVIGLLGIFWDITDKKRSESRLLEAEKIAHLGHWEMDIASGRSIWSDEFYKICGVTREDIPEPDASQGFSLIHPDDRKMASEVLEKALESGSEYKLEKRILRPDGRIRYVDSRGIIVRDSSGSPHHIVGTFFDITELKKTQRELHNMNENLETAIDIQTKALKESETKFRSAFDNAVHGMVIADWNGVLIESNDAFSSMLGYTQEEMMNIDFRDLTWHEDIENDTANLEKLHNGDIESFEIEKRYIHKSGVLIWCNLCVTEANIENEESRLIGQIININDQKKNRMALEAALAMSLMLGSSTLDEIIQKILTDSEIITDSKISYFHFVNPDQETISLHAWSERTMEVCEVPGRMSHYPISQAGIWVECIHERKTVIHNDYASAENKKGLPEGHTILLRDMAIPLFEDDKIVAVIGLGNKPTGYTEQDIKRVTLLLKNGWLIIRRKRLEEQLEQARDDAEKANQIKSQFLANISHEIRTPLNSVIGFSELMTDKIEDPKLLHYCSSINESGQSLLALINDILDLSKLEADKMTLQHNPVDLEEALKKVLVIFQIKAEEKGLDLTINKKTVLPAVLFIDEIRLHQILLNLLSNAIKFTSEGSISIDVSFHIENKGDSTGSIEISITDTGIGIPEEEQKLIFESFIQMSGQDNREYGGTGLGLSITSKLVQMMNGELTLKSSPGEGSVFTIGIPDLHFSNKHVETIEEEMEKGEYFSKSALIIDDNQSNREVLELNLKETGMYVYSADNGASGLKFIKEIHPDVVFLDLQMPGIDGNEVLKRIRETHSRTDLPVYAYTASTGKSLNREFNGILQKPVASSVLNNILIECFSKGRESKENIEIFTEEAVEELRMLDGNSFRILSDIVNEVSLTDQSGIDLSILEEKVREIKNQLETETHPDLMNMCKTVEKMIHEFNISGILKNWKRLSILIEKASNRTNG